MFRVALLLGLLSTICFGQENWGESVVIQTLGGGIIDLCNPSFVGDSGIVVESGWWEYEEFKIVYFDLAQPFYSAQPLPDSINLDGYHYISPFMSYSGERLYFSSDLPGGFGGFDIWVSEKSGELWSSPVNLGPEINSEINDLGASLTLDESEIFFHRNSSNLLPDGLFYYEGDLVIFNSQKIDYDWTEAAPLPEPVNIGQRSCEPQISSDGMKLYFAGIRPDTIFNFAYVSYRDEQVWEEPLMLNSNINLLLYTEWNDSYYGSVYSVGTDFSNTRMIFDHQHVSGGCPSGDIRFSELTVEIDELELLPQNINLFSYPNPFNSTANMAFTITEPGQVSLNIYNIQGRLVDTILNKHMIPGNYTARWQANEHPSGVYFARLSKSYDNRTTKLVLLK